MENELKLEKQRLREEKELNRLLKQKQRPKHKMYLWYLLLVLTLIYVIDEIISNLQGNLISEMSHSIFPDLFAQEGGAVLAAKPFNIVAAIAIAILAFSMFYKPLADKFGRKPFLVINTFGMGAAVAICSLARNAQTFWLYVVGFFMMRFFVTPDEQVVYIFETVDQNKRATTYSIIKGIAEFGLIFISLMRMGFLGSDIFGNNVAVEGYKNWRWIFLICAGTAALISLLALLLSRETDPYLDSRIEYLQKTPEQRRQEAEEQKLLRKNTQSGFFNGLAMVFKTKQLLFLCIATVLYASASSLITYYSTLVTHTYVDIFNRTDVAATGALNQALFVFPLTCGVITILYGFFSDKFGRKPILIALLSIVAVSFLLFIVGLLNDWNIFLLGAFIGLFLGGFWGAGDTLIMIASESAPTRIRVSAMTAHSLFFGMGQGISALLVIFVPTVRPELYCLIACLPLFVSSLVLVMLFVKETKDVNMEQVEMEFFKKKDEKEKENEVE